MAMFDGTVGRAVTAPRNRWTALPTRAGYAMSKNGPDLKPYMDKQLAFRLNGNRQVTGRLCGFDQFMNIVLDECQVQRDGRPHNIGMVVIRGNSVVQFECLDPVS